MHSWKYGYLPHSSDSEFNKPCAVKELLQSAIEDFKPYVVYCFINTVHSEPEMVKPLQDFMDSRKGLAFWNSPEDYQKFLTDFSRQFEEKFGVHYVASMFNRDEALEYEYDSLDEDTVWDRYEPGNLMSPGLYGYEKMPQPVPVSQEEIDEVLRTLSPKIDEELGVEYNLKLDDFQLGHIFSSNDGCLGNYPDALKAFRGVLVDVYLKDRSDFLMEMATEFHNKLPVVSINEARDIVEEEAKRLIPYDYHLDNMKCNTVVYLKETKRPADLDGNDAIIHPGSGLDWLYQQAGKSEAFLSDVSKELHNVYFYEYLTTFPVVKTMRELIADDSDTVMIPKGTRCGFFNPYDGSGGNFGIAIDKDLQIPKEKAIVNVDGLNHTFSLQELYGKRIWKPVKLHKSLYK